MSTYLYGDRAPSNETFVVISASTKLDNERTLAGTANQITVTDGGAGNAVTLSLPQNIHTDADVTFDSLILDDLTASRLVATDGSEKLVSVANLASWIAGTANQITVTDDSDGTVTLSTPQDLGTGSSPTFADINITESITVGVETIATADTLDRTNCVVLCNATDGAFTVTLPASSGNTGLIYKIKKIDSSVNAVTIDGNDAETIDGATTYALSSQYDFVTIVCDGSNWHII